MAENKAIFRRENWLMSSLSNPMSFFHRPKCSTERTRALLLMSICDLKSARGVRMGTQKGQLCDLGDVS